jgi:hypothetical protein
MSNEWETGDPELDKIYARISKQVEAEREKIEKNGKAEEDKKTEEEKKNETQVKQLAKIATGTGLFHAPNNTGYADITIGSHRETWAIRSRGFKDWLVREYYRRDGEVPNATTIQSALNLIEAIARYDGKERKVFVRVGSDDGKLYLDLADPGWNAIEIDAKGWRLTPEPPVRFRRAAGMLPLPIPQRGGKVDDLRCFLNVKNDHDFVLAVCWLLAALRDVGPYPVLALLGVHGAAKSTFAMILRALVDPNTAPLRALPRDDRDLFIAATNAHVLAFDNVSGLPIWLSDTLCRLANGGGFATRKLYSDNEEELFDSCRPIISNGIEDFIVRHDLADRSIFLSLQEIPERKRKASQKLMAEFERARPKILGALLTALSCGLKNLPAVKIDRLPRMADFAIWSIACELALWPAGTFMHAHDANRATAVETVIEADAVAVALIEFMANRIEWTGTATELLTALSFLVPEPERRGKAWPSAPNKLSGRLRRAGPFLSQVGIQIGEPHRKDKIGSRSFTITRDKGSGDQSSDPSGPSGSQNSPLFPNDLAPDGRADDRADDSHPDDRADDSHDSTVSHNPLNNNDSDDADASDDKSPTPLYPCAHCGGPGASPVAYGDRQAFVHPHCRQAWIAAQDGVFNQRLRLVAGSSQ